MVNSVDIPGVATPSLGKGAVSWQDREYVLSWFGKEENDALRRSPICPRGIVQVGGQSSRWGCTPLGVGEVGGAIPRIESADARIRYGTFVSDL
jgi:hypothetical protein